MGRFYVWRKDKEKVKVGEALIMIELTEIMSTIARDANINTWNLQAHTQAHKKHIFGSKVNEWESKIKFEIIIIVCVCVFEDPK